MVVLLTLLIFDFYKTNFFYKLNFIVQQKTKKRRFVEGRNDRGND